MIYRGNEKHCFLLFLTSFAGVLLNNFFRRLCGVMKDTLVFCGDNVVVVVTVIVPSPSIKGERNGVSVFVLEGGGIIFLELDRSLNDLLKERFWLGPS